MNYQQTLDYLYSQLPMFQRIGSAAYKADLDNTIAICKLLGNPENKFRSIHVAGTNGKGSTSHMLASVLQSGGLKVGLYTSPHLKDFRERIKINGEMISQQNVVDFVEKYKTDFEKIQPSFFEMTVGLAFDFFADQKVDIAVIEVGLGGRLDSTNIIRPAVSIITNISLDHTGLLGNSLEKIAIEKAGIIKSGIPIVIGETQVEIKNIFVQIAKEKNAPIFFADERYKAIPMHHKKNDKLMLSSNIEKEGVLKFENFESELLGLYQQKNIPTVLCAIDILNQIGFFLSEKNIREGIKNVIKQTGLLGRWQILSDKPLVIADTGHNESGIKEVLTQIANTPHRHLHFVLGMVNDKDISTILNLLPKKASYYFCKASIPRALDANELAGQAKSAGLTGNTYGSVLNALEAAKAAALEDDLVFVGGSTFTVAEVV
ncbi:MAG: dihydrofolate synthase [Bacteroidetes bacterium RIFCSPLOWO2_12_FULL_35_15]|nr:MAG: dihydrofolate synthase [Bacteroidetes bacterium RIFCSPLOWO2_12_FULL_35_15]